MNNNNVLTAYNYARLADFVYVEAVSHDQFKFLNKENLLKVINKNEYLVVYKNLKLNLFDGCVVFCHSAYIKEFFHFIKQIKKLKNITLVTCQSDHVVDDKLYLKKPKVVTRWFSTNVVTNRSDLFSLPIGLASNFSSKNLQIDEISKSIKISEKINKIYCSFNINTNYFERSRLLDKIFTNNLFVIENNSTTNEVYSQNLSKYLFVLCPPGNGPDTHRLWEVLYSKSIPIIKNLQTHNFIDENSVFKINDYKDINQHSLNNFLKEYTPLNENLLDVNYWYANKIKTNKINTLNYEVLNEKLYIFIYFKFIQFLKRKLDRLFKKINYYIRKVFEKLNLKN